MPMRKNLMIRDDHGILIDTYDTWVATCCELPMIEKHNLQQITNLHLILFLRLPCWQPATRAPEESMQLTMKQLRDNNKKSWNSQPFQHLSTSFNICHSTCHPRSCRVRHSCSCQQLDDYRSRHGAVDLRASARRREPSQISLAR